MDQEVANVSWKKFYVILAGRTNDAHLEFVANLNDIGQTEVNSLEESDYLLVFCPVASHIGADIPQALEKLPGGKPAILVVMHHTFNPTQVVANSRRLVDNPNVFLTVDCLFHYGKLLTCNRNNTAWFDIQKCLGVSDSRVVTFQTGNISSSSREDTSSRNIPVVIAAGAVVVLVCGALLMR